MPSSTLEKRIGIAFAAGFIALLESGYLATPRSRERDVTDTLARIERELATLRPRVSAPRRARRGRR